MSISEFQEKFITDFLLLHSKRVLNPPYFVSGIHDQEFLNDFTIFLKKKPTIEQMLDFKGQILQKYDDSQGYYSMYLSFFIQQEKEIRDGKSSMTDTEFFEICSEFFDHVKDYSRFLSFQEKLVKKYEPFMARCILKAIARECDIKLRQVE